jgi:hypothetical protein
MLRFPSCLHRLSIAQKHLNSQYFRHWQHLLGTSISHALPELRIYRFTRDSHHPEASANMALLAWLYHCKTQARGNQQCLLSGSTEYSSVRECFSRKSIMAVTIVIRAVMVLACLVLRSNPDITLFQGRSNTPSNGSTVRTVALGNSLRLHVLLYCSCYIPCRLTSSTESLSIARFVSLFVCFHGRPWQATDYCSLLAYCTARFGRSNFGHQKPRCLPTRSAL